MKPIIQITGFNSKEALNNLDWKSSKRYLPARSLAELDQRVTQIENDGYYPAFYCDGKHVVQREAEEILWKHRQRA